MFRDRSEAGRMLATEIVALAPHDPVVLALPRGGVPVAFEIASALGARLDLIIVRKVGAPGNPELAVAAIVDGNPPDVVFNREIIEAYGLRDDELAALIAGERPELERRRAVYRGERQPLSVKGKSVILVDDGAATGATMKVAARAIRRRAPAQVILALPIASPDAVSDLSREADRVVCLSQPPDFRALGFHYREFHQLDDAEVLELLAKASSRLQDPVGVPITRPGSAT
ncbi:phosphoribosyltransferase [Methylobrevis pamukkalensis]|uniref:Putative phosphoribosyl transferase n=1 Tax=Methylobrevis pamukkalensis TaxID=1439726 RepID=A0A1E3GZF3_9HYPH|nr:phosphoribosyltransferase [Methylobrevis pamukkalensis]ODN68946.1 putative phosphoribosyl transferase [Methylobrevis pamukkalensis]